MVGKCSPCFSTNTPSFHALTFMSLSSPPCSVDSCILGPVFPGLSIQGCSVLLTCRLPGECIICESCPIRIESVSCWLPAWARWWMLGKQSCCGTIGVHSRWSRHAEWDTEGWLCTFGSELKSCLISSQSLHHHWHISAQERKSRPETQNFHNTPPFRRYLKES